MRRLVVALLLFSSAAVDAVSPANQAVAAGETLLLDHVEVKNPADPTYLGSPGWTEAVPGTTTAHFEYTERGIKGDYEWSIPDTIISTGSPLMLKATATDTT